MTDTTPTTGTAVGVVAGVLLDFFGIDVPPLMWAIIGASLMQGYSLVEITRLRATVQVMGSALVGAILGLTLVDLGGVTYEPAKFLACALGGFGAHPVLQALLKRLLEKIGGDQK
jgi:hypothetical protein